MYVCIYGRGGTSLIHVYMYWVAEMVSKHKRYIHKDFLLNIYSFEIPSATSTPISVFKQIFVINNAHLIFGSR